MKTEKSVFLTGITGTAGSWLAKTGLERGIKFWALVRSPDIESATSRIEEVWQSLGVRERKELVEVVPGDITQSDLGLRAPFEDLTRCSAVIHCAACTEFSVHKADLNFKTNVEGTRHVLQLAKRLSVPFVYISTAYVAGNRRGTVLENELEVGQDFHNSYEQSKCQAEQMVRTWAAKTKLPTLILRPSILVGDSRNGCIARFRALYDLLRVFDVLAGRALDQEIRIVADPEATKNFIPVDYFARTAWKIIETGQPGTYHITHPEPIRLGELRDIFHRLFRIQRIHLVSESEYLHPKPSVAERMCNSAAALHRPYLQAEPVFDRSNTNRLLADNLERLPRIDYAFMERLLRFARQAKWGKALTGNREETKLPAYMYHYFQTFLREKMHQLLLPDVRSLTACFQIRFKENHAQHWTLTVQKGILEALSENGIPGQCQYVVDVPTFREVISGQLLPQQAFFEKRIDIEGDIETGLRVATVLAVFFRKFPFEVKGA